MAEEEGVELPPVGVMIETPASAMIIDALSQEVAFFSVGTNDLFQYTFAMDRSNERVNYLYDPLNLGFLRILKRVQSEGERCGKPVEICGEIAADPRMVYVFLGMGFRRFSMNPTAIPLAAHFVRQAKVREAQELVQVLLSLRNFQEREQVVRDLLKRRFPEFFS